MDFEKYQIKILFATTLHLINEIFSYSPNLEVRLVAKCKMIVEWNRIYSLINIAGLPLAAVSVIIHKDEPALALFSCIL